MTRPAGTMRGRSDAAGAPPPCPHAPPCGGCPYLDLGYAEQLEAKTRQVIRACQGYAELASMAVEPTAAAEPIVGYRRRAKWVTGGDRLGLYVPGTHQVVDLPDCRVLDSRLLAVARAIRRVLPWPPLVAIDLVSVEAGILVTWVFERPRRPAERTALLHEARVRSVELSTLCPEVRGVFASLRRPEAVQVLGHELVHLSGESELCGRLAAGAPWHYVAPGAFTQTHPGQERALHAAIRAAALATAAGRGRPPRVLELFAGSGALALSLAAEGASVIAVEAFAPSIGRGRRAADEQRLDVTFIQADATHALGQLVAAGERVDVVIVNPPRRGLEPELRRLLPRVRPELVVYVSCEPTTLARDLGLLARLGWRAGELRPFDMIPLTSQVEVLALLRAAEPPAPRVVYDDPALLVVEKSPHEPIAPESGYGSSLLERVHRLPGGAEAVILEPMNPHTSGLALFARRPEVLDALAEALARGSRSYVGLAKGILRQQGWISRPRRGGRQAASTHARYLRERVVSGHSLVSITLGPGGRYRLGLRLAALGHPLLGDPRFGDPASNRHFWFRHGLDRTFLHVRTLRMELGGKPVELSSPLPPDLQSVLDSLARSTGSEP